MLGPQLLNDSRRENYAHDESVYTVSEFETKVAHRDKYSMRHVEAYLSTLSADFLGHAAEKQ
ncbi:hypothetical protein, partial [Escherichia coli]|uniref:hypothetical protein n=1 Tax=Escherichia coli TaxID=562 RepID=UPI001AF00BE2